MSSENKDEHAYKAIFTAKSEDVTVEWTAYKTKIMGKARAKNLAAALKTGKTHSDPTKKASNDELASAWSLLIDGIHNNVLVAELARVYSDEDKDMYDPSGAYAMLNERFGGTTRDNSLIEDHWDKYQELILTGLPSKPTDKDMNSILNEIGTIVENLRGTHREVTNKSFCLDLIKLTEKCHPEIHRGVRDDFAWLSTSKQENPAEVEMSVKAAIHREMRHMARVDGTSELSALQATLAAQQKEIESLKLQAKSAATNNPRNPNNRTGNPNDNPNGDRDRPPVCPVDGCGLRHRGLCERDWRNLDKIDWAKVPANRKANKTIAEQNKKIHDMQQKLSAKCTTVQDIVFSTPGGVELKASTVQAKFKSAPYGDTFKVGLDTKCSGGCMFGDLRAFPHGIEHISGTVKNAGAFESKVIGKGTAALVHTDAITGKEFVEYYPNSYLVEGFDQHLLSAGCLMGNGFTIDLSGKKMITKSGATVAVDNDFDVAASYAPEAKLSEMRNVPEPTLAPTDLVSRGKKEPKIRPPIHITRAEMDTIELYMRRLGIPNPQRMRLLPDSVDGVPEALKKTPEGLLADEKMRANMKYIHRARSEMAKTKGSRAGRWVCYDLWSAPCAGALTGAKYMICFIDVSSGIIRIYTMTKKSEVPTMIERFLRDTRKYFDTKMLFADNAKEHQSKAVDAICNQHEIEHRYSCEYEPWQNAHVEHVFDTLVSVMRTMLTVANAPEEFWEAAAIQAERVHNIYPDADGDTPLGNVGVKASVKGLKVFGCLAYVRVPNAKRISNLGERSVRAIHLGTARYKPGWMFWTPDLGLFYSSQAIFNESVFPFKIAKGQGGRLYALRDDSDTATFFDAAAIRTFDAGGVGSETSDTASTIGDDITDDETTNEDRDDGALELHGDDDGDDDDGDDDDDSPPARPQRHRQPPIDPGDTQAQLQRLSARKTLKHVRMALRAVYEKAMATKIDPTVPKTDADMNALPPEQRDEWLAADDDEHRKVTDERKSFGEGVPIDKVKRAIPLTFSRKIKRDGTKKSRMCVQGFRLIKDVDYGDSYSPTIEWEAIRMIFSIGTSRRMRRHSCDFANAFCQTKMPEGQSFYCRMPKRYRMFDENGVELVYPLNMSLYGTVQAALLWYDNVSQWLIAHDFRRSETNPCVFAHTSGDMILTLYVDDVGIWERDSELYSKFMSDLKADYDVTFQDTMSEYLGANVEGNEETVYVHIADYIDSTYEEFSDALAEMDADPAYKCDIRIPAAKTLSKLVEDAQFGEPDDLLIGEEITLYRSVIGKLMHAMVKARIDISLAAGLLARAQAKPTKALL